jgi:hypothetical protein
MRSGLQRVQPSPDPGVPQDGTDSPVLEQSPMKDMTQTEALAEAIRRWGPSGTIKFRPPLPARKQRGRLARYCCIVGNGIAGSFYSIEGQGNSWREAFDDARPR